MNADVGASARAMARACANAMWAEDEASRALGMKLLRVAPGEAEIAMPITADKVNGQKICHGGFIFLLADSTFAFACNTYNQRVVAQHCAVSFLRPAQLDDILTAHAREVHRTARSGIYDVTVRRGDETVIAEFRGHSRVIAGTWLTEQTA
jgi:acyl-CoA thioesterase